MQRFAAAAMVAAQLFACSGGSNFDSAVHEPPAPQVGQVCGLDGFCWNNPLPEAAQINALWGSAWNDVWAAGSDGLLHFDGAVWKVVALPGGSISLRSLWGGSAHDVWAAGDSVFHWGGKGWTESTGLPAGDVTFQSITGSEI